MVEASSTAGTSSHFFGILVFERFLRALATGQYILTRAEALGATGIPSEPKPSLGGNDHSNSTSGLASEMSVSHGRPRKNFVGIIEAVIELSIVPPRVARAVHNKAIYCIISFNV